MGCGKKDAQDQFEDEAYKARIERLCSFGVDNVASSIKKISQEFNDLLKEPLVLTKLGWARIDAISKELEQLK